MRTILRDLLIASRPLSLSLALYSTSIGAALAFREGRAFQGPRLGGDLLILGLVTLAGISVQAATNFINDYFECGQKHRPPSAKSYAFLGRQRPAFDILVFLAGLACFGLTGLIGLYLIKAATPALLWVGLAGIVGGYCYTGEPVVYKRLGLGAALSFLLMGPLMNYGSWLALSREPAFLPMLLGLPPSLLIPLLMLANELRDFERDRSLGIRTLTVRIGFRAGKTLFVLLLALAYGLCLAYTLLGRLHPFALAVFLTLPLASASLRSVAEAKREGVPVTNGLHLAFGAIYILALALPLR